MALLGGVWLFSEKEGTEARYLALQASTKPKKSGHTQQSRKGVVKEIWSGDNYARVESKSGEVFCFQKNNDLEILELLDTVTCLIHERIPEKNLQTVRYLTADQALYDYSTGDLKAERGKIWHYEPVEVNREPKTLLFSASAEMIHFVLTAAKLELKNKVLFNLEGEGEIVANQGVLEFDGFALKEVKLEGAIQLTHASGDQFALAEKLTYYPDQQLKILEGVEKPVLFYDKEHDFQLAAWTVFAQKNPETGKETFRGRGDVQFVFGTDQIDRLKEYFTW